MMMMMMMSLMAVNSVLVLLGNMVCARGQREGGYNQLKFCFFVMHGRMAAEHAENVGENIPDD